MRKNFRTSVAFCVWLLALASGCVEGHAVPGTREGLAVQGRDDGGSGHGDGDGDPDHDMPDAAPPAPTCNPSQCEGASSLFGETPGCCTDEDRCGLDFSALGLEECLERDAPGPVDSACPATSVLGLLNFPGCCARGGVCGRLVDSFLPLGCLPGDVEVPIPGFANGTPMSCSTFTAPD